ncbi:hypothetical protein ACT7DA_13635 [Bacillus pacificus]
MYAEDPETFFPSPGKITDLTLPTNVRIDHFFGESSNDYTFL